MARSTSGCSRAAAAAARAMRAGTRRLVLLAVKSPANEVAKRLTTAQKLVLSDNPHGSVAALFTDCVGCAVDGLIAEAGGPAWDAEAFARIVEHVRPRLHAATYEVVTWAEEILRGAHEARMRLDALRSPALAPAVADIRAQLDGLIAPGFLTAAGTARLPALARYVKAIGRRLDKLADNAGRDAQQMAVVHRVQDAYDRRARRAAARGQGDGRRQGDPLADRGTAGQPVRADHGHPGPGLRAPHHDRDRRPRLTRFPRHQRQRCHVARDITQRVGMPSPLRLDYQKCYVISHLARSPVASPCERPVSALPRNSPHEEATMTGTPPRPAPAARLGAARVPREPRLQPGRGRTHPRVRPLEDQPDRDRRARHPRRRSCANCSTEYGVPAAEQEALLAIAHRGRESGWWLDYRDVLSADGAGLRDHGDRRDARSSSTRRTRFPTCCRRRTTSAPWPTRTPATPATSSGRTPWR